MNIMLQALKGDRYLNKIAYNIIKSKEQLSQVLHVWQMLFKQTSTLLGPFSDLSGFYIQSLCVNPSKWSSPGHGQGQSFPILIA